MADEKQILARARDYMKQLSEGRDPLTGRAVDGDSVLDEQRMRRCFAFVAAYIQRELERGSDDVQYFFPDGNAIDALVSEEDVVAADFYERLATAATDAGLRSVTPRQINHFLLREGVVDGRVESVFVERRVLRANERSEEVGIYDKPRLSARTGAMTHTLMFPPETQRWILKCLPDILACSEKKEGEE
jgi:hypothetical protein